MGVDGLVLGILRWPGEAEGVWIIWWELCGYDREGGGGVDL